MPPGVPTWGLGKQIEDALEADPDEIDDASWLAKYVDEDVRLDVRKAFMFNE